MSEQQQKNETKQPTGPSTPGPKNRAWDRPNVELAMDLRSWERVVLFTDPESTYEYPEAWIRPHGMQDAFIDGECVVLFDRVTVSAKTIVAVVSRGARMVGFCPVDVEHERFLRRALSTLYPWSEVYTASSAFGKVLMVSPGGQHPYDRNRVIDERAGGTA